MAKSKRTAVPQGSTSVVQEIDEDAPDVNDESADGAPAAKKSKGKAKAFGRSEEQTYENGVLRAIVSLIHRELPSCLLGFHAGSHWRAAASFFLPPISHVPPTVVHSRYHTRRRSSRIS